ncbi:multidrug ABC transporter ATPase [Paenibacillus sp. FSL R7-0273]|uniref:ABC transporter ATP-binding protein n=1 Tax=Paenibacillus sp. FSL R7-0273 TaxID=1536772 RepID=UPI0004F798D9|nr:ABC transporter ATP-binding protein [Paenibacillus sp. FSL R7-0273]AIQ44882.1 multidrug ABC transporter ATPase [Paenibacillus sp. FSL R7-0273]OMF93264.1 multidrug ABC transporter ATP-binding protein [Paenibacillus sp. FSL R7-0273]
MVQQAIELRDVSKKRHKRTIGPLNLSLPQGYITALVGQNGSGKSTLLHMLLQLSFPEEGEIRWFEQKHPGGLPLEIRQRMAYVPETSQAEENFWTAAEAADFRRQWYPSWDQEYFEELTRKFEIPQDARLGKMSKGERRKFEIAAALATRPRLLLLDEPSSGLDPFAWKIMIETLRKFMDDTDATVLICTHIVEEVRRLADYIVLMHQGQLLGMAEKDSLFGLWNEVWVNAADEAELQELAAELPEALHFGWEQPGVASFITREFSRNEKRILDLGVKVLKSRALELDEILSLWTQGHRPVLLDQKRGD